MTHNDRARQGQAYSSFFKNHQLLLYIVFVNARWELSHAARRREKPQGHLYIVLFLMFVRMYECVWGSVCEYLTITI